MIFQTAHAVVGDELEPVELFRPPFETLRLDRHIKFAVADEKRHARLRVALFAERDRLFGKIHGGHFGGMQSAMQKESAATAPAADFQHTQTG